MILSISDNVSGKSELVKISLVYLLVSLFCVLFGAVYEMFSHEVYSYYMLYAFVFPLAGGVLPFLLLAFFNVRPPGAFSRCLYHSGISAWTVGSLFQGVLEIYGTSNRLTLLYWIVGGVFVLASVALLLGSSRQERVHGNKPAGKAQTGQPKSKPQRQKFF